VLEFLLALLTTATVGVLLVPLLKRRVTTTARLDNDLAIYRDQLGELEREQAAGTLAPEEAKAARTEIERRILVAADLVAVEAAPADTAPLHRFLPPALCLAVPLVALGLYLQIGRPGLLAQPFVAAGARPAPAAAPQQDDTAALISAAKKNAADHPDDPDALSALGEALTIEADGVVTRPAVEAFTKALKLQPGDARGSFYLGLHEQQSGDSQAALKRWRELEAQSPPDAPWLPTLRAEIKKAGGTPSTTNSATTAPTTTAPGMPQPNQEQVEAMGKLSPEERQKTIRAMVDGLAAKLQDTPGDRDGWLRLANARKVLSDNAPASEAFARADALKPLDDKALVDWAEAEVRQLQPGAAPPPRTVAVLERLEKAQPNNGLALFYLGAASFAQGDKKEAARRWKALLALLPPEAPIRAMLEAKVKEAE
jgi:cytochrome c-type biogenesis protein CcmH